MPQRPGKKPPELSIRRGRRIRMPAVDDPRVYLVGAGPGDPELLTVRAARLLYAADFVYHDALVPQAILDQARDGAELVAVGHRAGGPKPLVEPTAREMARRALAGNVVVRLKGGDPFLFGRGGEEAQALLDAGVAFEVVPGVSSALAGPAAVGIPVTHRRLAASVTIVTGHESAGELEKVRWDALATASDTLVVLMGAGRLTQLSRRIISAGRPASTPAAVVMAASRPEQRQALATLADISQAALAAGIAPPAILVVGEVVALAQSLGRQGIEQLAAEVAAL